MSLTEQEILRYSRHIILPEVGGRGQRKLKAGSVLIAGLGPTGSAAALYLAAAGIGKIGLWDPGLLTPADLEGAIAHHRRRVGMPRAQSAGEAMAAINPAAAIAVLDRASDAAAAVAEHQVVLATAGDWLAWQREAVRGGVAAVFAAAHGGSGAVMAYRPGDPCLGCAGREAAHGLGLWPEGEGEAIAAAAGVVGVAAATEAIKLILGIGQPLTGRVLTYDGWEARFREVPVVRGADCSVCQKG